MEKIDQLIEEVRSMKDMIQELLRSNQMGVHSNNEIKQLLLGHLEQSEHTSIEDVSANVSVQNLMALEATHENANADLFKRITNVYFKEEIKRIESNNVRKSARRVSVEVGGAMCEFLTQQLHDTGLSFNRYADGLIIVSSKETQIGAIKILSDLGFYRGEQWFEFANEIVKHCKSKYDITNKRIFFVITSLRNGLDQKYVVNLLGREIRSNLEFMKNRNLVNEYVEKFTDLTMSLTDPRKQIYVMASELHPNVVADDLHKMNDEQRREAFKQIEEYDWISDINGLLVELRRLALSSD
ncbi:hypothetical protein AB4Z30_24660 [Paenibacillus sp. 2TAF8]|jgi:hypothetical protein|uniref:hypothetical protein n=1 Tax=Paenibacillus sp. 2TAF8 TaxID=3233020 RepID=UPI003F988DF6